MTVAAVAIVVPAHDEEELLTGCLDAISAAVTRAAQTHPDVRVVTVVVLDACTDESESVVSGWPVRILTTDARCVGTARRLGVADALRLLDHVPLPEIVVASTDADSLVPANWISHQIALLDGGADVVLGTVRPDFSDLSAAHVRLWKATHARGRPPGNVHGANLGVRASTYASAGGFADLAEHEDVRLVGAAVAAGAVVRASDEGEVVTSGRFVGRTPGGYATFLRDTHSRLERAEPRESGTR